MRILAIDTSTSWCSVALCFDDKPIVHRHEQLGSKASQHLLPWCSNLLQHYGARFSDLNALAVGVGPGAFTGVRLSVAVAQGLSTGSQLPVIPVTSLDTMASQFAKYHQMPQNTTFIIALDARMGEVYWARYEPGALQPKSINPIQLTAPEYIEDNNQDLIAGNALSEYADYFKDHFVGRQHDPQLVPNALCILDLAQARYQAGQTIPVEQLEPLYIRNKVALTTQERHDAASRTPTGHLFG
ncbi:MAG: tRNA ((37)-N6)-threonylcarbamoyltransferase complex dimerization subunit type 1 TsaB [Pseudomonadota bacterium]|jgi:tRNA threonylcarbamoyladenosine biosynthesis protein TsaB